MPDQQLSPADEEATVEATNDVSKEDAVLDQEPDDVEVSGLIDHDIVEAIER